MSKAIINLVTCNAMIIYQVSINNNEEECKFGKKTWHTLWVMWKRDEERQVYNLLQNLNYLLKKATFKRLSSMIYFPSLVLLKVLWRSKGLCVIIVMRYKGSWRPEWWAANEYCTEIGLLMSKRLSGASVDEVMWSDKCGYGERVRNVGMVKRWQHINYYELDECRCRMLFVTCQTDTRLFVESFVWCMRDYKVYIRNKLTCL